ncbi:hypothetical protein N7G274_005006 [Stereocaulon virgatum]|uniref:Uncharacterized protein n=1 Tax=Stereocaulon virgatum TaxID=373712 RepID=A0ABR4ABS7_9LECA
MNSMSGPGLCSRSTMCLLFSFSSLPLFMMTAPVLTLNPSQTLSSLGPGIASTANFSTGSSASRNSTSILDRPTGNVSDDLEFDCNSRFGTDLAYDSCSDAIASFQVPFTGFLIIGPREDGHQYNFNLPWRWISGDGRCTFDIVKHEDVEYGMATAAELTYAATSLMHICIRTRGGVGGIVNGVGWGGSLGLVMRRFDPSHIECEEEADPPFPDHCEELEQTMQATVSPLFVFGPQGGRGVTQGLPATFVTEPPDGCLLLIDRLDELPASTIDTSTYHEIWEDTVAIQGMCVRYNREGRVVGAGDYGRLQIWLLEYHGQGTARGANLSVGNQTVAAPVVGIKPQILKTKPSPGVTVGTS